MIRQRFGFLQLSNESSLRSVLAYTYISFIAALVVVANYVWYVRHGPSRDDPLEVTYLVAATIAMQSVSVRINRGRLTLGGIPIGIAMLLLNPLHASVMGLGMGIAMVKRGPWPMLGNAVVVSAYTFLGAIIAAQLRFGGQFGLGAKLGDLVFIYLVSWVLIAVGLSLKTGDSVASIARANFSPEFYAGYAYFVLAVVLASYVLDGSLLGYFLATIVFLLSLALTDTVAGRQVRKILESELSDADRHLFHSRAVEGVVHNLRNHMATAIGYLKEVDPAKLDRANREALETATAAANDAASVLRTLSQGATPKVTYSTEPIDLNDLVGRALGIGRTRAREKEIALGLRESPEAVKVKADPLLLREVITNLVNNAIDAAPPHGHVELSAGRRSNGWPYFSVADNGPGVQDEHRHHLFEPHFTTKETGTGLGLFMSYGIIREHQGRLSYEGNRRGAVFTVELPPYPG